MDKERFEFGENWSRFLRLVDGERIALARHSIQETLNLETLRGKTFLDAGSGSGLFSLAARQLGAKVVSFDYDRHSVACTSELRRRYYPDDPDWTVEQGSVLDINYLKSLGLFDVVYSWGVLHHTGNMHQAMDNVSELVKPEGLLYISIYNDQGLRSILWKRIKRFYNTMPSFARPLYAAPLVVFLCAWPVTKRLLLNVSSKPGHQAKIRRGISLWYDVIDWIGGYPFEYATPERIFDFFRERGFALERLKTCGGGLGCNEFVFFRKAVSLREGQTFSDHLHANC